ncbi:hypothetical protein [Anoxynatronum buryatiense]|uniref:Transglutaminase-like domain-containing protein n=1 Tax=Anoxynatronum buryatiense TaxID=489973 RepID=A0AA46AJK6_9CLOT|nr:hypothetical protein [Anoxynatronum buryatiense]SMP61416.1 hypothetical protein SAMN06296020_10941 [Anoxynatronum buryatiense]
MKLLVSIRQLQQEMIRRLSLLADGVYYVSPDELGAVNYKKTDLFHFPKEPVFLRDHLHTVSDVIHYLRAAYFRPRKGDIRIREEHLLWHHNRTGPETISMNRGNCGGVSSLMAYLLCGKFESVGFVALADRMGGHVFNYVYHDGNYYFIDLLNYLYASRSIDHLATMIYSSESIQQYADYYRQRSHREITLMVAYEGNHVLPMGRKEGQPIMFFPEGTHLQVLHESPHLGITVKQHPMLCRPVHHSIHCAHPFFFRGEYDTMISRNSADLP